MLRFRYGVQVNSLGLTEAQPENNVQRIVLEALAVTLCRDARARAIQLPAWNEAMGLPRPWDQQWSLRIQQVLANETDLLEYPDIFEGSMVMDGLVEELTEGARAEMAVVEEHGGAVAAVPYMKARLVESHRERVARIERGEQKVIGQNSFTETEDSPLTAGADGGILTPDPEVERERIEALEGWKAERDEDAVRAALEELARVAADEGENVMPATIAAAKAGATTGEWAEVLREVFGDYRAPTGVDGAAPPGDRDELVAIRGRVDEVSERIGHRMKILVGKPGLDGHSNGSEQIALRARDVGMEVDLPGHPPDPGGDRRVGAAGGRRRGRPLDPLRLAPRAGPRGGAAAARGGSRRPGRRRRHHPRRRRRARCARPASPASTRRRTSTSTGSWARSSSWSSSAPRPARRHDGGTESARPGCAATAAGRRTSRSRSTTTRSAASTPRPGSPPKGSTRCRSRSSSASTACTTSRT